MAGPLTRPEFAVLDACRRGTARSQRALSDDTGLSLGYVSQTTLRLKASGLLSPDSEITAAGLVALEPYKVTNAIIMAAGMSTRFAPVSFERPKGLLVVKGEILIERQIRQLRAAGIDDIAVVVGYRQEQFFYLEDAFGVRIVVNPDYQLRNNNSTIKAAEWLLDNTYICSSDNYFTENVFEPYVYQGYYAAVWHDGPTDEWGLTATPKGRIKEAVEGCHDTWVMMGQAYWDRDFSLRFRVILNSVYDRQDTAPKLWEAIYAQHTAELALQMRTYPPGVIWEFDTLDDLQAFDPDYLTNVDSTILDNMCATLGCEVKELSDFQLMVGGMTNLTARFRCRGRDYVYRHPGVGTQGVLNRAAEAQAEQIASEIGVDDTYIHMDPTAGWKISHFVTVSSEFDPYNRDHVRKAVEAIRKLHTSGRVVDSTVDLYAQTVTLQKRLSGGGGIDKSARLGFPEFALLDEQARRLNDLCQADAVPPVLCHNDFYAPNILVAGDNLSLIDWEYAGMNDAASDLGTFICCSDYTWDQAQQVFRAYYGRKPTDQELRHCVAYVGLTAYYWWVWSLYKDASGEPLGPWPYVWYRYAKDYGTLALTLYGANGANGANGVTGATAPAPGRSATAGPLPTAVKPKPLQLFGPRYSTGLPVGPRI